MGEALPAGFSGLRPGIGGGVANRLFRRRYVDKGQCDLVRLQPMEVASLLQLRNRLASALVHRERTGELPPAMDLTDCARCFQSASCALYHRACEHGLQQTPASLAGHLQKHTGHLTPEQLAWFHRWDRLVTMEEGSLWERRSEIWLLPGREREKAGRCISGLVMVGPAEGRNSYVFRKSREPFLLSGASQGDEEGEAEAGTQGDLEAISGVQPGDLIVLGLEGKQVSLPPMVALSVKQAASVPTRCIARYRRVSRTGLSSPSRRPRSRCPAGGPWMPPSAWPTTTAFCGGWTGTRQVGSQMEMRACHPSL